MSESTAYSRNTRPSSPPLAKGCGAAVTDINGRTMIDCCSQTLNSNLGQCSPIVNEAVRRQIDTLTSASSRFSSIPSQELHLALLDLVPPGLRRINLSSVTGSLANECALKAARKATGAEAVLSLSRSHLGQSLEAMRVSGKHGPSHLLGERRATFIDAPYCFRCPLGMKPDRCDADCLDALEAAACKGGERFAAIIVEPIMVDAGVLAPPPKYHHRLREIAHRLRIPLIWDEIQTAFGWLGRITAMELYGVAPDIVTFGKGLGAGFPLAATVLKEEFDVLEYGEHEFTSGAHPVSCAVSLALIRHLLGSDVLHRVREKGANVQDRLRNIQRISPYLGDVRGEGLLLGLEVVHPDSNEPAPDITARLAHQLFCEGILVRTSRVGDHSNVIQFKPPIVITEDQLDEALAKVERVFRQLPSNVMRKNFSSRTVGEQMQASVGVSTVRFLADSIMERMKPERSQVVYITGIDGSGKTSLAEELMEEFVQRGERCQIVHVDDFHHKRAHRYVGDRPMYQAYLECSIDFALLVEAILRPLKEDGKLDMRLDHLDLATDEVSLCKEYRAGPGSVVLVEGVFLAAEELLEFCDTLIYVDAALDAVLSRGAKRDADKWGSAARERYLRKYLPAQLVYEAEAQPRQTAHFTVENTDLNRRAVKSRANKPVRRLRRATPRPDKPSAVVFDLWNTVCPLPDSAKEATRAFTASALGLPLAHFDNLWATTRSLRETMDLEAYLWQICEDQGVSGAASVIQSILKFRAKEHGLLICSPAGETLIALEMLRVHGLKTSLLSNCTSDVSNYLLQSELRVHFDDVVLSSDVGVMKPSRRAYEIVAERLGLAPEDCLYIGDGNDSELLGAQLAGMTPVLLETAKTVNWTGTRIERLSEVVGLALRPGRTLPPIEGCRCSGHSASSNLRPES